jgi:SAM-dependent methyltransferase
MEPRADTMPRAHFESLEALEYTYWWHVNRRRLAVDWLRSRVGRGASALDLGCGTGGFAAQLGAELAARRVIGIDTSATALHASARRIEVIEGDLSTPFVVDEGAFDVVTAMDVLEHLPDEKPLLETAWRNLRKGGLFLASVPALPRLYSSWDRQLGHLRRYTRQSLRALLGPGGWRTTRCSYAFFYALVPAMIRRRFGKPYADASCVFPPMGNFANGLLKAMGTAEIALLRLVNVPIGLSLFVLAEKTDRPQAR